MSGCFNYKLVFLLRERSLLYTGLLGTGEWLAKYCQFLDQLNMKKRKLKPLALSSYIANIYSVSSEFHLAIYLLEDTSQDSKVNSHTLQICTLMFTKASAF